MEKIINKSASGSSNSVFLSVVIPTYNRNDLLSNCLKKLSPIYQELDESLYEVIVTDDSPNLGAKDLITWDYPWAKWVKGPGRGPAANRNNGAKYAVGEWLVFIDDDCLPDKELLQSYYFEMKKGKYKAMEGMIDADRPRKRLDEVAPINLKGGCFWACNIAVEKNLFNRINGFDEVFPYAAMEDVDFADRLKAIVKTTFLESAKVIHPWRRVRPFSTYKRALASQKIFLKKNGVNRNLKFRHQRFNLFLGVWFNETKTLIQYSFRGKRAYMENVWIRFVMIFI